MGASSGRSVVRSRGKRDSAQLEEARVVGGCGTGPCRPAVHDVCRGEACAEDSRTGRRAAQWRDRRTFTRRMQHALRSMQHAHSSPAAQRSSSASSDRHSQPRAPCNDLSACLPLVWSRAGRGGAHPLAAGWAHATAHHRHRDRLQTTPTVAAIAVGQWLKGSPQPHGRSCGGSQRGPTG